MWGMSKKAHRQRISGALVIVALSLCSEFMVSLVKPEDRLLSYYSMVAVAVVLLGAVTTIVLLFYRTNGRGLRFSPTWWDWGVVYLSAAAVCWMSGWLLAQGIGMVVQLAPLPSIVGVLVMLMYRLEPFPEHVEREVIREVTEEEWHTRTTATPNE